MIYSETYVFLDQTTSIQIKDPYTLGRKREGVSSIGDRAVDRTARRAPVTDIKVDHEHQAKDSEGNEINRREKTSTSGAGYCSVM